MEIKDILTINLSEDIKNVIDLEDISEAEVQAEIENYIITDGLAKEYSDFISIFTSNILESGVWISGFYGSGKSYFGKLLGYMLSNRNISGTPARDRILQRFTGINDEALIKNTIAKLSAVHCRVVFLDVAKQDTSRGLAFTLFRNFLKSMELPDNEHGFLLYHLMINDNQSDIYGYISRNINQDWVNLKNRLIEYARAAKTVCLQKGNNESDYNNLLETIREDMKQFSASRLKEELINYLQINKNEKVIFLFDEASEAINQNKYNLLDLEGISEALTALGGNVWTIAIAQEKLDDVINNSNVSKAQLTKVTDRFKTKIHLEATEVDVIIRNRLLKKKDDAVNKLKEHYQKNSGKITDHAALNATGIAKTDSADSYSIYYPFYKYQFNLMQNFLFGSKGYASTKVAARGMIITTYEILKLELQHQQLFDVATGWQIAKEAEPQPPVRLVNRYDNAANILQETGSNISGRRLLETINFLSEAEIVPTTLPNIVKSFIDDPDDFHKVQEEITKALDVLIDRKVLLSSNNTYRITSDIEQRLLGEMNGFTVQGFVKKKQLVDAYKASPFIKELSRISDNNQPYDFYITTDNDDEITNPSMKYLKLKIKSIYNISDNRTADVEALKVQHQNDKDLIWLIPDNRFFSEIDKLIDEIKRISYLEDNYSNPLSEEARIIRSFSTIKSEKENYIKDLIEQSLLQATSVYLYNTYQLDKTNSQSTLQSQQRQVIQNVYFKRLTSQLSDAVAPKVIKEAIETRLHSYFDKPDFQFFDNQGNFIGENLKVAEEILYRIRNTFVDGGTLEKELEQPPTGFSFGTVVSTVAALMRAGKVMAKYNGSEKFSWRDEGISNIFAAAREFRKATFKAIAKSLSAQQKNEIVNTLQALNYEDHTKRKVDWNTNDFELVNAVRELAKRICDKVDDMRKQNKEFNTLFGEVESQKCMLAGFTGAVNDSNYIDKAENFLANKDAYGNAVQVIEKVEKFIRNNLPNLLEWNSFVINVNDELNKSTKTNATISQWRAEFNIHYNQEVVTRFGEIQQIVQKIKDEYFKLMQNTAEDMARKYIQLKTEAEALIHEIAALPAGLNDEALKKTNIILLYADQRTQSKVDIGYDIKDKNTRFTYSEMLSFIELFNTKKIELEVLKASLVKEAPVKTEPYKPKSILTTKAFPPQKLKVSIYKQWLQQELQKLASAKDDDEIEINNN